MVPFIAIVFSLLCLGYKIVVSWLVTIVWSRDLENSIASHEIVVEIAEGRVQNMVEKSMEAALTHKESSETSTLKIETLEVESKSIREKLSRITATAHHLSKTVEAMMQEKHLLESNLRESKDSVKFTKKNFTQVIKERGTITRTDGNVIFGIKYCHNQPEIAIAAIIRCTSICSCELKLFFNVVQCAALSRLQLF